MFNKKGSALMQVLLVTVIIATIATFILRMSISRTTTAAASVRGTSGKNVMEGCQAEVQTMLLQGLATIDTLPKSCQIKAGSNDTDIITVNINVEPVPGTSDYRKITYTILDEDVHKL